MVLKPGIYVLGVLIWVFFFFFSLAHYKILSLLAMKSFSVFMLDKLCYGFARWQLALGCIYFQAS